MDTVNPTVPAPGGARGRRPSNYYELLGLDRSVTEGEEIRAAVLRQSAVARNWAMNSDPERARQVRALLADIELAGAVLSDPARRLEYDGALALELEAEAASADASPDATAPARKFAFRERYQQSPAPEAEPAAVCPGCSEPLPADAGESCPACGLDLRQKSSPRVPHRDVAPSKPSLPRPRAVGVVVLVVALAGIVGAVGYLRARHHAARPPPAEPAAIGQAVPPAASTPTDAVATAQAEAAGPGAAYRQLLRQGQFPQAAELATRETLASSIPAERTRSIVIFGLCTNCTAGICDRCAGKGQCAACGGQRVCPACKGSPPVVRRCLACLCPKCKGKGVCPACAGQKAFPCKDCLGTGFGAGHASLPCPGCRGTGRVSMDLTTGTRPCPTCKGVGHLSGQRDVCGTCGGTARVVCAQCGGEGRCANCGGRGTMKGCSACNDTLRVTVACKTCQGSGKCVDCAGDGKCRDCGGTGKCRTCEGASCVLACRLVADAQWMTCTQGVFAGAAPATGSPAAGFAVKGRTVRPPVQPGDQVVVIAGEDEYAPVAGAIFK